MSDIIGAAVLALALAACDGGPRIVIDPEPDEATLGVGLDAEFRADVRTCGAAGDCAAVRDASVKFEDLDGVVMATDVLRLRARETGITRLHLRWEDLEREVAIRALPVMRSQVFLDTLDTEREVRVFRGSTASVGQRHQDSNGRQLFGRAAWLDDGLLKVEFSGRGVDGNYYRRVAVPDAGVSIATAMADPQHIDLPLRIDTVDESAISELDIKEPSAQRQIRVTPLAHDGRPICGGLSKNGPLVASDGLTAKVLPYPCGVNVIFRQASPGPHSIEIRWGSQSRVLPLP